MVTKQALTREKEQSRQPNKGGGYRPVRVRHDQSLSHILSLGTRLDFMCQQQTKHGREDRPPTIQLFLLQSSFSSTPFPFATQKGNKRVTVQR